MRCLVSTVTNEIMFIAEEIEVRSAENSNENIYFLKDKEGNELDNILGNYYIFDTGDNKDLEEELLALENPNEYCIVNGVVMSKNNYTLGEINRAKRDVMEVVRILELNVLELLYEESLRDLGLK